MCGVPWLSVSKKVVFFHIDDRQSWVSYRDVVPQQSDGLHAW